MRLPRADEHVSPSTRAYERQGFARARVSEDEAAELRKVGRVVYWRAGSWWCDLPRIGTPQGKRIYDRDAD